MSKLSTCWIWFLSTVMGSSYTFSANCALAQNITLDGTLGPAQTLTGQTYTIPQDVGQTVGNNLFHSFGKFNLNSNEAAVFQSAANIRNILSRVTGGTPSSIDGLIATESFNVNLFLINPSGIIFGPNARLDVGSETRGSFFATTVDTLVFPNGGQFSATNPGSAGSLLTIVGDPSGFLASQRLPTPIQSSGSFLRVYEGQSLILLGGEVNLDDALLAAKNGRIELGGVADALVVGLNANGNNLSLRFPDGVVRSDVSLTNQSGLSMVAGNGGSIAINARNLNISGGSFLFTRIEDGLGTIGSQAGNIDINATGVVAIGNGSDIVNVVGQGAIGNSGNINITTGSLFVSDRSRLIASTSGQGNAGSINIAARDTISLDRGFAGSIVIPGAVGSGGSINISTGSLFATNGSQLTTNTLGQGKAGSITIDARDTISFDGVSSNGKSPSAALNTVENGAVGEGGSISITARSLSLTNGGQLQVLTRGQGNGGTLTINTRDTLFLDGVGGDRLRSGTFSNVESGGKGLGGSINITTGSMAVTNGAGLVANTNGQGDAGSITIVARDTIAFDGDSGNGFTSSARSDIGTGAKGSGGSINITTGLLAVTNGAQLDAATSGEGNAGNITINARDTVSFDSGNAFSSIESGAVGKGGNISITTGSLAITNGAGLVTSTRGRGDAGSVIIETGMLNVTNDAGLFARTDGQGNAGNVTITASDTVSFNGGNVSSSVGSGAMGNGGDISITTALLSVSNGAELTASTRGRGNAGSITIDARDTVSFDGGGAFSSVESGAFGNARDISIITASLGITNGGGLFASTRGQGDAGNVTINARDIVFLDGVGSNGFNSVIASTVESSGVGKGGDINITTRSLTVTNGAALTNSSTGQGSAGDTTVTARSLRLENQGFILSTTTSGDGGDITLNLQDLLLLRQNSLISTSAGTAQAGGDGGNITINVPFIVAIPKEDSNISANAFTGRGGRVNITTSGIFGIQSRSSPTLLSDITASSERGIAGIVEINTPDVDPSRGLVQLPTNVVDATQQIDTGCQVGGKQRRGSFTATGRGGIAPSPTEPLMSDAVLTPWVTLREDIGEQNKQETAGANTVNRPTEIVEASGWVVDANGTVVLVAQAPTVNPHSPWLPPTSCPVP